MSETDVDIRFPSFLSFPRVQEYKKYIVLFFFFFPQKLRLEDSNMLTKKFSLPAMHKTHGPRQNYQMS